MSFKILHIYCFQFFSFGKFDFDYVFRFSFTMLLNDFCCQLHKILDYVQNMSNLKLIGSDDCQNIEKTFNKHCICSTVDRNLSSVRGLLNRTSCAFHGQITFTNTFAQQLNFTLSTPSYYDGITQCKQANSISIQVKLKLNLNPLCSISVEYKARAFFLENQNQDGCVVQQQFSPSFHLLFEETSKIYRLWFPVGNDLKN